jgi:hypothetical protein
VFAVVEHDLEHPVGVGDFEVDLGLIEEPRAVTGIVE